MTQNLYGCYEFSGTVSVVMTDYLAATTQIPYQYVSQKDLLC